jgi:phage gp29-like protein
MRFIERFVDPLILGKVNDPAAFVNAMTDLGLDSVIGISTTEDIQAITSSSSGEFEKIHEALGRRIQKVILGQTLTSDIGSNGSYAAAQTHNLIREDKKRADIKLISNAIQKIINALWSLNGIITIQPVFVMADDTGLEIHRSERDKNLAENGLIKFTEQYFISKYDFRPGDFTIPLDINPQKNVNANKLQAKPQIKSRRKYTADQEMIEDLVAGNIEKYQAPVTAAELKKIISESNTPEELILKLNAIQKNNDMGQFQELMERALFTADVIGYATAAKDIGD